MPPGDLACPPRTKVARSTVRERTKFRRACVEPTNQSKHASLACNVQTDNIASASSLPPPLGQICP
eukprot:359384-Chlamydomonas_euryale.AAC.5